MLGWLVRTAVPHASPAPETHRTRHIVMTVAYAAKHEFEARLIVRADGGRGRLSIPGLNRTPETAKLVHIVDLDDRFDTEARANTHERVDGYLRLNLTVYPPFNDRPV